MSDAVKTKLRQKLTQTGFAQIFNNLAWMGFSYPLMHRLCRLSAYRLFVQSLAF